MMSAASVSPPPSKRARIDAPVPAEPLSLGPSALCADGVAASTVAPRAGAADAAAVLTAAPHGKVMVGDHVDVAASPFSDPPRAQPAAGHCDGPGGSAVHQPPKHTSTMVPEPRNDGAPDDVEGNDAAVNISNTGQESPARASPPPLVTDAVTTGAAAAAAVERDDGVLLAEQPPHDTLTGATLEPTESDALASGAVDPGSANTAANGITGASSNANVTADAAEEARRDATPGVNGATAAAGRLQPPAAAPRSPPAPASLPTPTAADAGVLAVAEAFRRADRVLVLAGAGWSAGSTCADGSRLPDYRSSNTFAATFPALAARGLSYRSIATPAFFERDPETAWGFYATRVAMYRGATPHEGYDVLRRLVGARPCFVATSNVDGFFARAGFPAAGVCEVHGCLERVQCSKHARHGVWRASKALRGTAVDPATMRASSVPRCRAARCSAIARPNVLLFNDLAFAGGATESQRDKLADWVGEGAAQGARVLVVELGAGAAVPTIREIFAACSLDLAGQGCEVDAVRVNLAPASSDEPFVVGGSGRYHRLERDARAAMAEVEAALASVAGTAA